MKPFQIRKMWAISQACLVKRKGKENGFPFDYLIISLEIQRRTFRKNGSRLTFVVPKKVGGASM